jgi:hypothetical protein
MCVPGNQGIPTPTRTAPLKGSPHVAAAAQTTQASIKLSQLNKAVHKGGASTIEVPVIKPLYSDTFTGSQSVTGQQVANAALGNKALVQGQGDKAPLVKPNTNTTTVAKGGRRRIRIRGTKRKTMKRKTWKKRFRMRKFNNYWIGSTKRRQG